MNADLLRRVAGSILLLVCFLAYGSSTQPAFELLIIAGLAASAYLLTGAAFAVFFTAACLAISRYILADQQLIHLLIAISSTLVGGALLWRRWQARIIETREARWKNRH